MKRFLLAVTLFVATIIPAFNTEALAADVGVSISIGQPGFYGRLDIGGYPQPQVIYREPKVIRHIPNHQPPVYMHVPRGHARHWHKHCHEYNACHERVLFVQDYWYNHRYVPYYQKRHGEYRNDSYDNYRHDKSDYQEYHWKHRHKWRGNKHGHGHNH